MLFVRTCQELNALFGEIPVREMDLWTSFVSGPLGLKLKIDVMELKTIEVGAPQMHRHRPTLGFASRTGHVQQYSNDAIHDGLMMSSMI